ncbi:MAG: hypothetical protein IKQ70_10710 [Bacteroidales bacterium]|nr:hypothetical protein [Bacteroidales bacterium]
MKWLMCWFVTKGFKYFWFFLGFAGVIALVPSISASWVNNFTYIGTPIIALFSAIFVSRNYDDLIDVVDVLSSNAVFAENKFLYVIRTFILVLINGSGICCIICAIISAVCDMKFGVD